MSLAFAMALIDAGYEPERYSGRGMFGRACVSVQVARATDLFKLGFDLAVHGAHEPDGAASIDSLGRGYVVYWPAEAWEEPAK